MLITHLGFWCVFISLDENLSYSDVFTHRLQGRFHGFTSSQYWHTAQLERNNTYIKQEEKYGLGLFQRWTSGGGGRSFVREAKYLNFLRHTCSSANNNGVQKELSLKHKHTKFWQQHRLINTARFKCFNMSPKFHNSKTVPLKHKRRPTDRE